MRAVDAGVDVLADFGQVRWWHAGLRLLGGGHGAWKQRSQGEGRGTCGVFNALDCASSLPPAAARSTRSPRKVGRLSPLPSPLTAPSRNRHRAQMPRAMAHRSSPPSSTRCSNTRTTGSLRHRGVASPGTCVQDLQHRRLHKRRRWALLQGDQAAQLPPPAEPLGIQKVGPTNMEEMLPSGVGAHVIIFPFPFRCGQKNHHRGR